MPKLLLPLTLVVMGAFLMAGCGRADARDTLVMYKTPSCACCEKWAQHLEVSGFTVKRENVNDLTPIKMQNGIGYEHSSCHTGVIGGYVVEGHVPADVIRQMLDERPDIRGLTVPGMPIGSPGMEGPNPQPYDILAIQHDGSTEVYASR